MLGELFLSGLVRVDLGTACLVEFHCFLQLRFEGGSFWGWSIYRYGRPLDAHARRCRLLAAGCYLLQFHLVIIVFKEVDLLGELLDCLVQ